MPKIIQQSISILSDAGLGMAMFSLGEWACSMADVKIYIYIYNKNYFKIFALKIK